MNCKLCRKKFTTKQCFEYHIYHNVCQKKSNYNCTFCGKNFSTKSNLNRHVKQKICIQTNDSVLTLNDSVLTPNDSVLTPNDSVLTPNNSATSKENLEYKCKFCNKNYSKNSNLRRHEKTCCKKIKIDTFTQQYINKIQKLEDKIVELENNQHTTIINQNKQHIHNYNQTINIKINNFGNENISLITDDEMFKIVNKCYSALIGGFDHPWGHIK